MIIKVFFSHSTLISLPSKAKLSTNETISYTRMIRIVLLLTVCAAIMPFTFSLGKVVGAIAGVFNFQDTPNQTLRAMEFAQQFEQTCFNTTELEQQLNMHVNFSSFYNVDSMQNEEFALKKLVNHIKSETDLQSLDFKWFNNAPVMESCINHSKKTFAYGIEEQDNDVLRSEIEIF